jgi:hypothetical protein
MHKQALLMETIKALLKFQQIGGDELKRDAAEKVSFSFALMDESIDDFYAEVENDRNDRRPYYRL